MSTFILYLKTKFPVWEFWRWTVLLFFIFIQRFVLKTPRPSKHGISSATHVCEWDASSSGDPRYIMRHLPAENMF